MARNFDGSGDIIDVPGASNATIGTIAAWIKADTLPPSTERDICWTYYLASESESFGTYDKALFLRSSGIVVAYVYDGATKRVASTSAISTGTWYHIAMTFSNADDFRVWFNGVNEATTVLAGDSFSYLDPNFRLCGLTNTFDDGETTRSRLDGSIADLHIWTVVLNAEEVTQAMRGAIVRPHQQILWLPLWGITSPEPDWSGSNAHGTLTGTVRDDHPPGISAVWLAPHPRQSQVVAAAAGQPSMRRWGGIPHMLTGQRGRTW